MADLAIGIMSGTSADGIDAALIAVGDGDPPSIDAIAHIEMPFTSELRQRILSAGAGDLLSAHDLARLHGDLGDLYAEAALALIKARRARPVVIGLHGQTVAHLPGDHVTLQIGDAARVAVRTGIATVDDLRSADIAAGGQGAPLTPFADHLLFAAGAPRVVVNIGGIANVTLLLDNERDHVTGFDTGPGNMVLDAIARMDGRRYDTDGAGARRGRVVDAALNAALAHPYFARPSPKSTGREEFGEAFAQDLVHDVRAAGGSLDDALATATELTARTISRAIAGKPWREILIAGGGAANPALRDALARHVAPAPRSTSELGIPTEAREAIAFALLALYRVRGLPNTLPRVTGASRAVVAGALHLP
ncbi:MAG: anhydro-N-acetylmuramic acid kinase [Chloroflexi bacterium]|nr:anhydro-N-acetylmuramic acid kinase [Chloroflexota bacterium]